VTLTSLTTIPHGMAANTARAVAAVYVLLFVLNATGIWGAGWGEIDYSIDPASPPCSLSLSDCSLTACNVLDRGGDVSCTAFHLARFLLVLATVAAAGAAAASERKARGGPSAPLPLLAAVPALLFLASLAATFQDLTVLGSGGWRLSASWAASFLSVPLVALQGGKGAAVGVGAQDGGQGDAQGGAREEGQAV